MPNPTDPINLSAHPTVVPPQNSGGRPPAPPTQSQPLVGVSSDATPGVLGQNLQLGAGINGVGVSGFSEAGPGVSGQSNGVSTDGVLGHSQRGNGVHGMSSWPSGAGVLGENPGAGRWRSREHQWRRG